MERTYHAYTPKRFKLSEREVLGLLVKGYYFADLANGTVVSAATQRPLALRYGGRQGNRPKVVLTHSNRSCEIFVSRLVWMWGAKAVIPPRFYIHHRNKNVQSNGWPNLFCLHWADHNKLHGLDGDGPDGQTYQEIFDGGLLCQREPSSAATSVA